MPVRRIAGVIALAAFLGLNSGLMPAATITVSSSHIALYGNDLSHAVGLYTSPTYSLPNASFTYPGSPSPASTSKIVINVDGMPYGYNSVSGTPLVAAGSGLGASLSGTKSVGGLTVSVRHEIVLNPQDGANPDTMMLRLTLRNPGPVSRQVGARLQWDTDINSVDGANISVNNGFSVIPNGLVFRQSSGNIPGNWWGYDIPPPPPTAPNLVGRGSVFGNPFGVPASMPDAFEVVGWGSVSGDAMWSLGATGMPIGDSAVVLWWTGSGSEVGLGHSLAPGAEISFVAYYGMNAGSLLSTFTPTPGPSATVTPSPSRSPSFTVSPTRTPSATGTPSRSATPSYTRTPSFTITPTHSISPTFTPSPTITPTATATPLPLTLTPKHPNPNPAREAIYLPYLLSADAEVDIRVFSVAGELVRAFDPAPRAKGAHEAHWDLRNGAGVGVASGVYIYRIRARSPAGEEADAWMKCAVSR